MTLKCSCHDDIQQTEGSRLRSERQPTWYIDGELPHAKQKCQLDSVSALRREIESLLYITFYFLQLTLILLTWRIWWANNASKWQIGFNLAFKGLIHLSFILTSSWALCYGTHYIYHHVLILWRRNYYFF